MNPSRQQTVTKSAFYIVCGLIALLAAAGLAPQTRSALTPTPTPTPGPPSAPVATSATSIGLCRFTANWTAVVGATGYRLDVFTGYSPCDQLNVDVGNVTSQIVFEGPFCANFNYLVRAYNAAGTSPDSNTIFVGNICSDATPTPTPTPSPPRALNFSTRVDVETGDDVAIGGFIVTSDIFPGTVVKTVVIRALGPSLGSSGVGGTIANPVLELHEPDGTVITNNNWKDNSEIDRGVIAQTGLNMYNGKVISDLESVLVATLPSVDPMVAGSGQYTAVVSGLNGDTGVGLVEVYDIDPEAPFETPAELANISTRGIVGTADNALIGGVIIGSSVNETTPTASVVVRAIGPSLANANPPITDPLADPFAQLVNSDGMTIATNDNWMDGADAATIQSLGLAPANDLESALLANLIPGKYTAIVMETNSGVGVASVEIFRVPTQTTVRSR